MTIENDGLLRREFPGRKLLKLAEGNQLGAGKLRHGPFIGFANVDEAKVFLPVKTGFEFNRSDFHNFGTRMFQGAGGCKASTGAFRESRSILSSAFRRKAVILELISKVAKGDHDGGEDEKNVVNEAVVL